MKFEMELELEQVAGDPIPDKSFTAALAELETLPVVLPARAENSQGRAYSLKWSVVTDDPAE